MSNRKEQLQFRIEPELLERVDTAVKSAPEFEGNRSQFIRRALSELAAKVEKAATRKQAA